MKYYPSKLKFVMLLLNFLYFSTEIFAGDEEDRNVTSRLHSNSNAPYRKMENKEQPTSVSPTNQDELTEAQQGLLHDLYSSNFSFKYLFNWCSCLDTANDVEARKLMAQNNQIGKKARIYYKNLADESRRSYVQYLDFSNLLLTGFSTVWQALRFSQNEHDIGFLPAFTTNTVLQCSTGASFILSGAKLIKWCKINH